MVQTRPIRVALDAHVVGRRETGNETYVVDWRTRWPLGRTWTS